MVVVVRMVVGSLVMLVATLTTKAAASVRSERQADLIRHQLLKDLGMEAAPDTAKVGKISEPFVDHGNPVTGCPMFSESYDQPC